MDKAQKFYARNWSASVIDIMDDFLNIRNIKIPSSEREKIIAGEEDTQNLARIYGADFNELDERLVTLFTGLVRDLRPDINIDTDVFGESTCF